MALQQILTTLTRSTTHADEAQRLARQQFFAWVLSLPDSANVHDSAARADSQARHLAIEADSPAAINAFRELLRQTMLSPAPARRASGTRRGRNSVLHG